MKKFLMDESGMETVEYAVVAALVIITGILVWSALGTKISETISKLTDSMNPPAIP